jgi:hypothetical protein
MPYKASVTEIFRQLNTAHSFLRRWPFLTPAISFLPVMALSSGPCKSNLRRDPKISPVGCNKRRRMKQARCSSGAATGDRQAGSTVWNGKSVTQRWDNKSVVTFGSLWLMNRADQTSAAAAAASLSSSPQFWALRRDSPFGQNEAEGGAKNGAPKFHFPPYALLIFSCTIDSSLRS